MDNKTMNYTNQITTIEEHTRNTFLWMFLGLLLTAGIAYFCATTGLMLQLLIDKPFLCVVLIIAQIGVAISIGARLSNMRPVTAKILYFIYATLMGISFSSLMLIYDLGAIFIAFGISALYFGCLTVIGYTTKYNLMKFGPILMVGLFVLIVAEIIMIIMGLDITTKLMTGIGLVLFTGITIYDTQKMKVLYESNINNETILRKLSIYSAFELYLDFVNIFLYILRLVGSRD